MAGDWIKMRTDLAGDTAVMRLAVKLGLDEDTVVGKLHRFWVWATSNTADGRLPDVELANVDRSVNVAGFGEALLIVGWLRRGKKRGLVIPNFDRHMSRTAKARAGEAVRKNCQRKGFGVGACPDNLPDKIGTRAEKRRDRAAESREEKRINPSGKARCIRFPDASRVPGRPQEPDLSGSSKTSVVRMLALVEHAGRPVFPGRTAASIAVHPAATSEKVAWAIERFTQEAAKGRVKNAGGYLRRLIEDEEVPAGWREDQRRAQLAQIATLQNRIGTLGPRSAFGAAASRGGAPPLIAPPDRPAPGPAGPDAASPAVGGEGGSDLCESA